MPSSSMIVATCAEPPERRRRPGCRRHQKTAWLWNRPPCPNRSRGGGRAGRWLRFERAREVAGRGPGRGGGGLGFGRAHGRLGAAGGGAGLERAQGAQRLGQLLVDARPVAGEGEQALQAGLGRRLLLGCGLQRRELEPAQPLLAPEGGDQLGRPMPLEGVARAPVAGDGPAQLLQLGRALAGQRGERTAAQAVAGAVPGGTSLAGLSGGAAGAGTVGAGGGLLGG